MKLIVGLGNPGKEYEKSRHNIGFMIIKALQKELDLEPFHKEFKFQAHLSMGIYGSENVILAKPFTYMNLSGEAVHKITQFYKIHPEDCLIVYDDLDLPLGTIRMRKKGSAGSHNGMKSIVSLLNDQNFPRLRFGIESRGVTAPEKQETSSFVLSPFFKNEENALTIAIAKAVQALKMALSEGVEKSMSSFNG